MDDNAIIELFFERSENAIVELSAKYGLICIRTAENITFNKEDAQECVNDAYLGVWNAIPLARPKPLLSYVLRIVRNVSINRVQHNNALKRRSGYQECLDELEAELTSSETPETVYDAKLLSGYIEEFLDGLSRTDRLLFVRRYWYLDSFGELAAATGLRQGTVRTRLTRLRQRLKQHLFNQGVHV